LKEDLHWRQKWEMMEGKIAMNRRIRNSRG